MGSVEILESQFLICSHIITYGNSSTPQVTEQIREEIETMWNEPEGIIKFEDSLMRVIFKITASHQPAIQPLDICQNLDPRNNYFRIEEFAHGNISFVDGLGCNSGYFKLENLYKGSTTAAHEYGQQRPEAAVRQRHRATDANGAARFGLAHRLQGDAGEGDAEKLFLHR
jgi:hypothetical protein